MANLQTVANIETGWDGDGVIIFNNGYRLSSSHDSDCCESHCWSLSDLTMDDFNGLQFDLDGDNFFERVEGYGIKLLPVNGFPISIPGYGYNNGYYSENLSLVLSDDRYITIKEFDITECQTIDGY